MRNLGKIVGLFLFVFCAFQANAQKTLEQYVAEEAAQCPKDMGGGMTGIEVSFDGEDVNYIISCTDEAYAVLKQMGAENLKATMIESTKTDPMVKAVMDRDVCVGMAFVRASDEDIIPIVMTPNDFHGAIYGKDLKYYITYTQERCPVDLSNGITLSGCEFEEGVLVYVLTCSKEVLDALIASGEDALTQSVTAELRKQYAAGEPMTKLLVEQGVTIGYGYTDGERESIIAVPAELIK